MSATQPLSEKFFLLSDWMPSIIECIKKDLKNEHLKQDPHFVKKYFHGKNPQKIDLPDLIKAYSAAIQDKEIGEQIAEFIANRWIFRNSEMYHFFEENLSAIQPNFTEIVELSDHQADQLMKLASEEFGAALTYIFSLLNGVAFPQKHLERLKEEAQFQKEQWVKECQLGEEKRSYDELVAAHTLELARLKDKYEKKLQGLQKKYTIDMEMLKKQLANTQRKLAGR